MPLQYKKDAPDMKKRLMILGAGTYQVPLIKKAKDKGLTVIVVSPNGNYPGIKLADIHIDIDTTDEENIIKAAVKYKISGITTTGTDVCVPSLGRVVDELGLAGTGYEAACKSMDKILMKQAFVEYNVLTAKFDFFKSESDAKEYACLIGYPVIVKATDSSGSRGIAKVDSGEGFNSAWIDALEVSRSKEIIIEEYLEGIEFGAQAFIKDNEVTLVFPHGDTVTPGPYFTPVGHSMPTQLPKKLQVETKKIIEKAVQALGINNCISNVDLMLVNGMPAVIEIGARMGATCLPENISIYSGVDAYEYAIDLALGNKCEYIAQQEQANACLLLMSDKTGTLKNIHVPKSILEHEDLIGIQWDVSIGDKVRKFTVGPDRIGHIIVKGKSAVESEKLVEHMVSQISLEVV